MLVVFVRRSSSLCLALAFSLTLGAAPARRAVGATLVAQAAAPSSPSNPSLPPLPTEPSAAGINPNAPTALSADDQRVLDAREAWRRRDKGDRARLVALRDALVAARHPLAVWADYWELSARLDTARQDELDAFYTRWPGTYLEDRLRNDWLLILGARRDWVNFAREIPRFRMNDDREVACYALVLRQQRGEDVRDAARSAWMAQRDGDDGCWLLGRTLFDARVFGLDELWARARLAAENNRPRAARQSVQVVSDADATAVAELFDNPQRYLQRKADATTRGNAELTAMAVVRWSASDPAAAAAQMDERWQAPMQQLGSDTAAWAWSALAKNGAIKLMPEAEGWFQRALAATRGRTFDWNDDTLAWRVRAALRATDAGHWQRVQDAIEAMSPAEQREPAWQYWKARAITAQAAAQLSAVQASVVKTPAPASSNVSAAVAASSPADLQRLAAQQMLERLAGQLNFYGKLASDDLGRLQALPARPAPPTPDERSRMEQHAGLARGLALIALGLRNEGVREWNFALRDFSSDRELLAAAQLACDRQIWDRCINTSERTKVEIDMAQRFPTPYRTEVTEAARKAGLDPALVYGLIRQESRFIADVRSSVGAAGLMQLMPSTAKWTAKRIGLNYSGALITDRATNLELGTAYFKLLLDDFEGSAALAAAGYNAGPNRPRRWRDGPVLEVAAWAENIPFNETRDYVKKVLSNASYYAALLAGRTTATLKPRLGPAVGPRPPNDPPENKDLP
jgi:soluble lytic murein transglycosylase